jgi:hypothetical protein
MALEGQTPADAAGIEVKGQKKWLNHPECLKESSGLLEEKGVITMGFHP